MAEKPERQLKKQSIKVAKHKSSRKRHSGCFLPVKADIRKPLLYLLITFIVSKLALLMIQTSPHPLLIAPAIEAGDLIDSLK